MDLRILALALSIALAALSGGAAAHGPYTFMSSPLAPTTVAYDVSRTGPSPIEPGVTAATHHHHPFVSGTCRVTAAAGVTGTVTCGVDRDGDGLVSDSPVCALEATLALWRECTGSASATRNGEHADDWVDGAIGQTKSFCFQDNVRGFTDDVADDDGINDISAPNQHVSPVEHGDGWDQVKVIVLTAPPNMVTVAVTTAGDNDGCGFISAHITAGNTNTDGNGRDSTECFDSIDNDGDALVDRDDPGCLSGAGSTYNAGDNSEA